MTDRVVHDAVALASDGIFNELLCMECVLDESHVRGGGVGRSCRSCLCLVCGLSVPPAGICQWKETPAVLKKLEQESGRGSLLECRACAATGQTMCTRFHPMCIQPLRDSASEGTGRAKLPHGVVCKSCGAVLVLASEVKQDGPRGEGVAVDRGTEDAKAHLGGEATNVLLALLATDPRVPFEALHAGATKLAQQMIHQRLGMQSPAEDDASDDGEHQLQSPKRPRSVQLVRREWPVAETLLHLPGYHVPATHHWQYPPPLTEADLSTVASLVDSKAGCTPARLRRIIGPALARLFHRSKQLRGEEKNDEQHPTAAGPVAGAEEASPAPKVPSQLGAGRGRARRRMMSTGSLLASELTRERLAASARMSRSLGE
jgi:hypothetical protein